MVSKVTKKLDLKKYKGWSDIDPGNKDAVKKEIGDFVVNKVLQNTAELRTSVASGKWKQRLSPKYAKVKSKMGRPPVPDMELKSRMLRALRYESRSTNMLEVGIFAYNQAQKADNHNKFSPQSKSTAVPERNFIPRENKNFNREIENGIKRIIKENSNGEI